MKILFAIWLLLVALPGIALAQGCGGGPVSGCGGGGSSIATPVSVANGGTNSSVGSAYNLFQYPILQSTSIITEGDSITAGYGATSTSNGYASLVAADAGATLTNQAVSGQLACDLSDTQAFTNNLGATKQPILTMMIGTNDANTKGVGSYEAVYKGCHQASLSWLTVSSTYKVAANSSGCVQTGTWTVVSGFNSLAETSTTNASTLTCSIQTYGGVLYAWYREHDSDGGTFTYAVDGGSAISVNTATSPAIATQNGGTHGENIIRISGLVAGTHSIVFTVTSSTSASNSVTIFGVGTPPPNPLYNSPKVFSGGVPTQCNNANAATTLAYNNDSLADQQLLNSDGLPIVFVNIRNYWINTTANANCYDSLHPNNLGHQQLEQAFDAVAQFIPTAVYPITQSPPVASNVSNYMNANGLNNISSTSLNGGLLVYNGTNDPFGIDFGKTSYGYGYSTRIFESNGNAVTISYAGSNPTSQSSFTDMAVFTSPGSEGYGSVQEILPCSGNACGLQFANSGSGGKKYDLYSTAGGETGGAGQFQIADATAGAIRLELTNQFVEILDALISGGTTFTISGCSTSSLVGGADNGTFVSGTTGTCTPVITIGGATGATAPNGWNCFASDRTTPTDAIEETSSTTTTATLSGTAVSGDVIQISCRGY